MQMTRKTQNLTYGCRLKLLLSVKNVSLSCVTSFCTCDKFNGKILPQEIYDFTLTEKLFEQCVYNAEKYRVDIERNK